MPGLALAIVKDGDVLLSQGFGYRDLSEHLPVTPYTRFAIGSATKAFTAMTLAMLVDDGVLDWHVPVKDYLPAFRLADPVATAHMTPLDLLIHNSGLPSYLLAWYNAPLSRRELVERLAYLEPTREFRAAWQYQNFLYTVAGYLVEVLSGQPWEGFLQQRLLTPLDMRDTTYSVQESRRSSDVALPYRLAGDQIHPMAFYERFQAVGPAGSMNSTLVDMTKWLRCLLNQGQTGLVRLVSEAQFAQLVSPHILTPAAPTLYASYPKLFDWTYGCGWFVTSYRGHRQIQHSGHIDGFNALVSFLPQDRIGLVLLSNRDNFFAHEVFNFTLCDRLLGLEAVPWQARFQHQVALLKGLAERGNQAQGADRGPGAPASHPLSDYTGVFEHPGFGTFTMVQEGEHVQGRHHDLEYIFTHAHDEVFEVTQERLGLRLKGSFSTNLKGGIESFSIGLGLEAGTPPIVFRRVADRSPAEKKGSDAMDM